MKIVDKQKAKGINKQTKMLKKNEKKCLPGNNWKS